MYRRIGDMKVGDKITYTYIKEKNGWEKLDLTVTHMCKS
jgi:hypothetical protein